MPAAAVCRMLAPLALLAALAAADRAAAAPSASEGALPTVASKTAGLERRAGLLTLHVDPGAARVWLELPPPRGADGRCAEVLHLAGLARGLGSNPVGLDRGQLGEARLVVIRRVGTRVLFEQPNLRFLARSTDADERRAAEESFATSILWGAAIAALDPDGRALVDLTPFLVRDAHGIARALGDAGQGEFSLDLERSVVEPAACLAFPDNLELEATLTFAGRAPGPEVRATAPTPEAVTLVQHQSFIRPPAPGFRPRPADLRTGVFAVDFVDMAVPLDEPVQRAWAVRHRLEKLDPAAPLSPVREPIVYYVDRGAPEPVRSALIEGAAWWSAAFERAGFLDAFRVELLPEDAHPLDVRYNVIQWVHRATRGWSYGNAIVDPRTGEILKGHVTLGSLRVRHDRRLFEGLAGTSATGTGGGDDPVVLSLARIRQLAAHEVGHTLGLAHNFAASTYGRASVMDYPAPLVDVAADGALDFSRAYGEGVGAWDHHAIRWAYAEPPPGRDEAGFLAEIVRDGIERGLLYLSDEDARGAAASDARGSLWDNGDDPIAELERVRSVRRAALERFGERNLAPGRPLAELEEVLAIVYAHHRYQLEAAVKRVGGLEYQHAARGDGQRGARIVAPDRQREALAAVLATLEPAELDLRDDVLALLLPPPPGAPPSRERFANGAAPAFDALGAAATAAAHALEAVLEPARLARVADFHRRDGAQPSLEEVFRAVLDRCVPARPATRPRLAAIEGAVARAAADRLVALATGARASGPVRAHAAEALREAAGRLRARGGRGAAAVEARALAAEIARVLERETAGAIERVTPPALPPGPPIGAGAAGADDGCAFAPARP